MTGVDEGSGSTREDGRELGPPQNEPVRQGFERESKNDGKKNIRG